MPTVKGKISQPLNPELVKYASEMHTAVGVNPVLNQVVETTSTEQKVTVYRIG